ncbi:hypothetical protein BGX38DRAFT_1202823 [Terfezia claveryi]|nr:hypothetical protein BGX38DRAFT_1202823 [Terfezia claveryi]
MKLLSITCLLLFSALTNALPNAAALPDALVEREVEIVARDAGADTALVGSGDDTGAKLSTRMHIFCWRGWDRKNYQGNSIEECCDYSCCPIKADMLINRLYSAKATGSSSGGVTLWTGTACNGENRWVDTEGWWNLEKAPAYRSYSA